MAPRWPIFVGVVAITGGIAWFALKSGDPGPSRPATPAPIQEARVAPTEPGSQGRAAISAPAEPSLATGSATPEVAPAAPALPPAAPPAAPGSAAPSALTPEQSFPTEQRDPAWAGTTETEVRRRLAELRGGKLEAAECRRTQCQLTIAGTEEEVGHTLAELATPRGLIGFADHVFLTGPEPRDGKLVIRAYAVFDRDRVVPHATPK